MQHQKLVLIVWNFRWEEIGGKSLGRVLALLVKRLLFCGKGSISVKDIHLVKLKNLQRGWAHARRPGAEAVQLQPGALVRENEQPKEYPESSYPLQLVQKLAACRWILMPAGEVSAL